MPLGDVTYQNASLDAIVNAWPSTGTKYHLYWADPSQQTDPTTVELGPDGGYAPANFTKSGWAAADSGAKATSAPITHATSTAAFSDIATYWAIVDSAGLLIYSDALDEPIAVTDAGFKPAYTPSLSFADGA